MKGLLMVVLLLLLVATVASAGDRVEILGLDYGWREVNPFRAQAIHPSRPLAAGALTWSDEDYDFEPGIYGQMAFFIIDKTWRINVGAGFILGDEHLETRPLTSLTVTPFKNVHVEMGAYYAPFWGLDPRSDDPWGLMLGYTF